MLVIFAALHIFNFCYLLTCMINSCVHEVFSLSANMLAKNIGTQEFIARKVSKRVLMMESLKS